MKKLLSLLLGSLLLFSTGCRDQEAEAAKARQQEAEASLLRDKQVRAEAEREAAEKAARYKSAIETALQQDLLTGHTATADHTASMRSIDLSACPPEFRVAYMAHIHAWDEAAAVMDANAKLDANEMNDAVAGGLATLFSSDATPYQNHLDAKERLKAYAAEASSDIKSTFEKLELIAASYGARLPHQ